MNGDIAEGVLLGVLLGWTLRGAYESAWDRWIRPRLMRWFLRDIL